MELLHADENKTRMMDIENELNKDAVYAGMDDRSRRLICDAAAELSRRFCMEEGELVRRALDLAWRDDNTVCYYLYADEGRRRLQKELGQKGRIRRCIPDPTGKRTVTAVLVMVLGLAALFISVAERKVLGIFMLPLAWTAAMALIGRFYPLLLKPRRLLKMERVSEDVRTLVVLPVLLSSVDRAEEMLGKLESLGCLEKDKNIDFLLLGDFRDSEMPAEAEDGEILDRVRGGIGEMNRRSERKKYYYLHRQRKFRHSDGKWMGENRKRGALRDLNRLLLGIDENGFEAENGCKAELAGKYRYVVTLDSDTEYLPGTLQELIGAMEHPLNQGYALLQPDMGLAASACTNEYVKAVFSSGGADSYPASVSNFYQDMCGSGCFAGKGIYRIAEFYHGTENKLPEEQILSHDLIEGILAGAGYLNDVHFYDGCPDNLAADLQRSHRWIRGDWQLLPLMLGRGISALDRMKMLGNLLRSLHAPALFGLLICAMWLDAAQGFALGLMLAFLEPVLRPGKREMRKRAMLELAILPAKAAVMLDAILRTQWRLFVSKKHLMEWVPAADASGEGKRLRMWGIAAAILVSPGLLTPFWMPAALALGGLFLVGAGWAEDLAAEKNEAAALDGAEKAFLYEAARRIWDFFAAHVPENGLPPDNVQMDPHPSAASRTSPTNIGLYLISCLSAEELGFIGKKECAERMERTVSALESMAKWHGQLYNWYDIRSLAPLKPGYVSSVDSGNLAAALLLCGACTEGELSRRLRSLAENMDLAALYDEKRQLFHIGAGENGELSRGHYDLYASEARILSFVAMMLGQVPAKHWRQLARPAVNLGGCTGLASWNGTMFEYLMPAIFFGHRKNTLAGQAAEAAIACQKRYAKEEGKPWGISESGYYAFDEEGNYQYRAFGLRKTALNEDCVQDVAAPYAAALALCADPKGAVQNMKRMRDLGWMDEYGFYEAADYRDGGRPRLVKSHMAHHQGMILCCICNALKDNALSRSFMEIPGARALELLLQERQPVGKKK